MANTVRALNVAVTTALRADRWLYTAVLALSSAAAATGVLSAYWLKWIVDAAGAGDEAAAVTGALGLGATVGAGLMAGALVTRMQFPLKERTGVYLDRRIVALAAGIEGIEHHERPDCLDRLDVLRREMFVLGFAGMNTAAALGLLLQVTATGVLLVSVNPLLLAVPLFALPSLWAGARAERIRQRALDTTAERSRQARHLFELATSPAPAKEIRIFGLGPELLHRHGRDWERSDRMLDAAGLRGVAWTTAGWACFSVGYAAAIALIVGQAVNGRATVGDVVLGLALVALVNGQVGAAAGTLTAFVRMVNVADRYLWLQDYAAASRKNVDDPIPAPERLVEGIHLRGVGFRYAGSDVDVLSGLDLSLPAGATVALVGDNGAGKSTLVKLLCRLYEPSAGTITVDGVDLRRIDVAQWRERLSAGFQDFSRLELQAGQTVGVGDLPLHDDVTAVARALERAASTDVMSGLPEGLGTQLGASFDAGVELSGGQWQKLALARAMMRPTPLLLVLDEPTANLDPETEHLLFSRYASMASTLAAGTGAITLLVSHRFSTVRMADLIVVLDGGRILAAGSHDELMNAGGLYAELFELQARAYR